jgi:hypothetical protein
VRQDAIGAIRRASPVALGSAIYQGVALNVDKLRGMGQAEIDAKYGSALPQNVIRATPYRRQPERT